jgi:hypothetical protein
VTTPIATLDAAQHLALRLHLGLLRADQQKIEDDEDEDEREELDEEIPAAAARRLGPCLGYEHLLLLILPLALWPPRGPKRPVEKARGL